jgi:hypothetical protein
LLADLEHTTIGPAIKRAKAPGAVVHTDEPNIDAALPNGF